MKKFLALVALVCMVLTSTAAFAAFPSKSAPDMTIIEIGTSVDGVTLGDDFSIFVTDPTAAIDEEVKAIAAHVESAPIATYYSDELQQKIAELTADPAALVGYELVPVACANYKAEYGDVTAKFTFATPFADGTEVIVTLKTDAWTAQKSVVADGKVEVAFTGAELTSMETTPALMVVQSAPIA